jgi:uncharacterized membrane protein YbhN (UPF0104 family)
VSWLFRHNLNSRKREFATLVALAAVLYLAGGVGMSYVTGFEAVHHRLVDPDWPWLIAALGGVVVAFAGYYMAYRGIDRVGGRPRLSRRELLAVAIAGFGGFLAQGGAALDDYAMQAAGRSEREAKVRVTALGGFEYGVLALIVCPTAIAALAATLVVPGTDFTWPWAVIPPLGFAAAFWAAERYRERLRNRRGLAGALGVFLDGVHLVRTMFTHPRKHGLAVAGMAVYWGAEMFALWATTTAFGYRMSAVAVIVALGTGMILTRRTAPLGGAGLLLVALTPTLWFGASVPFAAATLGVFAYQFMTLWLPMPASFASLPALRALGQKGAAAAADGAAASVRRPLLG